MATGGKPFSLTLFNKACSYRLLKRGFYIYRLTDQSLKSYLPIPQVTYLSHMSHKLPTYPTCPTSYLPIPQVTYLSHKLPTYPTSYLPIPQGDHFFATPFHTHIQVRNSNHKHVSQWNLPRPLLRNHLSSTNRPVSSKLRIFTIYIYNSVEFVRFFVYYRITLLFLDEMQSNSHGLWSITWEVTWSISFMKNRR